jgi:hypothetical protein
MNWTRNKLFWQKWILLGPNKSLYRFLSFKDEPLMSCRLCHFLRGKARLMWKLILRGTSLKSKKQERFFFQLDIFFLSKKLNHISWPSPLTVWLIPFAYLFLVIFSHYSFTVVISIPRDHFIAHALHQFQKPVVRLHIKSCQIRERMHQTYN